MNQLNKKDILNELNLTRDLAANWLDSDGVLEADIGVLIARWLRSIADVIDRPFGLFAKEPEPSTVVTEPEPSVVIVEPEPSTKEARLSDDELPYKDWEDFQINYSSEFQDCNKKFRAAYSYNRLPMPFVSSKGVDGIRRVQLGYLDKNGKPRSKSVEYHDEADLHFTCRAVVGRFNRMVKNHENKKVGEA
jgi:hypothetical protein